MCEGLILEGSVIGLLLMSVLSFKVARIGRFRRVRRSLRVQDARRMGPKTETFNAFSSDFLYFLQLTGRLS
jgi:hypothetical protein